MASGPSVDVAKEILDGYFGGIAITTLPPSVDVRLWTVAPDFDGTGGTEVTGGAYTPAVLAAGSATVGGVGQIAKILSSGPITFYDMPSDSTDVVAFTTHDHIDGRMLWLNDSWTSPTSWAVGESPQVPAAAFFAEFVPV